MKRVREDPSPDFSFPDGSRLRIAGEDGYPKFDMGAHGDEDDLALFAKMFGVQIVFTKLHIPNERLVFWAPCGKDEPYQNRVWYVPAEPGSVEHLHFRCHSHRMARREDSNLFRSYSDLQGAEVTVELDTLAGPHPQAEADIIAVLTALEINPPGRRPIILGHFTYRGWIEEGLQKAMSYTTVLPAGSEP